MWGRLYDRLHGPAPSRLGSPAAGIVDMDDAFEGFLARTLFSDLRLASLCNVTRKTGSHHPCGSMPGHTALAGSTLVEKKGLAPPFYSIPRCNRPVLVVD